ncbi:SH3 domain-containing protein [Sneathiella sp.]|jgi:SH3-like domain-containing protein|uniref:SH3 domain-containing protein n=1 Tax=Sneathiella sp. TaxID=1964365 RepID=UPI0039E4021F
MFRALSLCVPFFVSLILMGSTFVATAQTGLPVPRFVSLSVDEVNVRVGPGRRYPIAWTFVRVGWPVEVIAEYEHWRQIRDIEGATGWVHKSLLSGRRTILITGDRRPVYEEPDTDSEVVLLAEPGVQGTLAECDGLWCEVDIAGNRGWLKASHFYGVYENEKIR